MSRSPGTLVLKMFERQVQTVDQGAIAIQAGGSVQCGVSYEAARQIALDVYELNFPRLVEQAAQLARARAEELTDKFFEKLKEVNPEGIAQARQPDFQSALWNAQKEHACAGDDHLADLLVDFLVERTRVPHRALVQIVLDEAIKTVPKLTQSQISVIGVAFLYKLVTAPVLTWEELVDWSHSCFEPLLADAEITSSTLAHLQYAGCGALNPLSTEHAPVERYFLARYPGFFQAGFPQETLEEKSLSQAAMQFVGCLQNDPNRKCVTLLNNRMIEYFQGQGSIDNASATGLKELLGKHLKSSDDARVQILTDMPFLAKATEIWKAGKLHQLSLSSVGIAIGHACVQKMAKHKLGRLSGWIN